MVGKGVCRGFVLICFSLLFFINAGAQEFKSEAELKKKAEELFDQGDYVAANPLFSQLLSLYPKDPNYNFKFGVCLLFTTENKEKPLTYLEFASKKAETEKEVFFFLGRAYHLNYRFTEALNAYENFKKNGNAKSLKKFEVDQQITMCRNGISLLKNVKDLYVLEKKSMKEEDFFRAYNTESLNGKLIVKPDEFKTSVDRKKKESSVMFISPGSEELYISSYGQDDKNGKDIYRCKKLPSGEWGPPQNLSANINTTFDEDYPFLHADGKTLYFSSKGHNSMGGYDVFKSVYDSSSGTWSAPVNLDFAVSTPDDDIFFMPDSGKTYAYFASKRNSPAGRVDVYKLKVDMVPVELAIVKGKISSEVGGQSLEATISVRKAEGGELVGEFKTNPKTGEYYVSVPNGGRFTFDVESPDFSKKSEIVVIPTQYELKALRQTIALKPNKLIISNFFDEVMSEEDSKAVAMAFLKEKAKLEVNYSDTKTEATPTETNAVADSEEPESSTSSEELAKAEKNSAKFSNQELVEIAKEDAEDARKDAEELQDKSDNANFAAKQKEEEAQTKLNAATEMEASANSIADPAKKEEEIQKANLLRKEADLLNKEATAISTLAQTLYKESQEKFKEAKENEKYAQDLEQAVKSNSKTSILQLTEQRAALEASSAGKEKENDFGLQQIKAEATAKQEQSNKAEKELEELKTALAEAEAEQKTIRGQADKTKNKKEKQALTQQADLLTPDIEEKRKEVEKQEEKADLLASESATATNQLEIFSKVLNGSDISSSNASSSQTGNTSPENLSSSSASPSVTAVAKVDKSIQPEVDLVLSKPESPEKQKELANVYDKWAAGLQKEAEARKTELKSLKDPQKRSDVADAIMALESAAAEKMALASDARGNADQLASSGNGNSSTVESGKASEGSQNQTAQNQNNAGNSSETQSTAAITEEEVKVLKEKTVQINSSYEQQLASVDNLSIESEKTDAKVVVLDNWVKALAEQSSDLKKKIAEASQPDVKQALETELTVVESQYADKQNQASVAFSKAERSKKQTNDLAQIINTPAGRESQYSVEYAKQINAAEQSTDPAKSEAEKAVIYEKWTQDIRSEKTELETLLQTVTDEASKRALEEKILKVDQFLAEQSALADQSKKAAENTEPETASSEGSPVNNEQNNSSSSTHTSSVSGEINSAYVAKLASTENIQDADDKKKEQAKVLNEWSEKLTASASEIRTKALSIPDDEIKNSEISKAEQLESEADRKRSQARQLEETLASGTGQNLASTNGDPSSNKQTQDGGTSTSGGAVVSEEASNTSKEETIKPVDTARYEEALASAEKSTQGDELAKVEEKRKIYDSWSREIEKQITLLKKEQASASSQTQKDSLDEQISELERVSLEKQAQASLQVAKADRLRKQKEQELAANSSENTANPVNENQSNSANNSGAVNSGNDETSESNPTSETAAQSDIEGTSSSSGNETQNTTVSAPVISKEAITALNESSVLKFRADSLRKAITSVPDQSQRADMLARSVVLEKESYKKRVEASSVMSAQSTTEFKRNSSVINEYSAVSSRNQSDEVTMANMLSTESEFYQKEAKTIRSTVSSTTEPNSSTISVLERAEEYEKLAVEKQLKAIALYSNANKGFIPANQYSPEVASVNNEGNPTVARTNNTQTTEDSTAQNASIENKVTEQTNVQNPTEGQAGNATQQDTASQNESATAINPGANEAGSVTAENDTAKVQASVKRFATTSDSLNATKISGEAQRLEKIAVSEEQLSSNFKKSAQDEKLIADSLRLEATKPENSDEKTNLEREALNHESLSVLYSERADSVVSLAANSRAAADAKRKEAELLAMSDEKVASNDVVTSADRAKESASANTQGSNTDVERNKQAGSVDLAIPEDYLTESNELKREIFIAYANKSAYSSSKPIPIDNKIPNGIIFKVQVGAFRNPIAPEVLKGFAPLMGETSANGITRYTAGFFKVFDNANAARKEINGMGYRDAFVVAFCNGKRISVSEAQRLVREGKDCGGAVLATSNAVQSEKVKPAENNSVTTSSETGNSGTTQEVVNNAGSNEMNQPAVNVSVEEVKGLFYTVQVGVYSAKIPASKLNYLQPLYSEPTSNGLVRYSVGMYDNLQIAKKAKEVIVEFGVKDAFVTAYANGKRISVSEAGKIEAEGGKAAFATGPDMNRMPEAGYLGETQRNMQPVQKQNQPGVIITSETTTTAPVMNAMGSSSPSSTFTAAERASVIPLSDTGLVFRVQIGAFKDEVPVDIAAKFIRIADKGVNHYEVDSLTIYTVGGSRDYQTAEELKKIITGAAGLSDAFVVAYRRGEKINLEEAIKETTNK